MQQGISYDTHSPIKSGCSGQHLSNVHNSSVILLSNCVMGTGVGQQTEIFCVSSRNTMKCPDLTKLDSQSCKADAKLDGTAAIDSIHTSVCFPGYMSPCLKVWSSSYVPVNRHSDTAANRKTFLNLSSRLLSLRVSVSLVKYEEC